MIISLSEEKGERSLLSHDRFYQREVFSIATIFCSIFGPNFKHCCFKTPNYLRAVVLYVYFFRVFFLLRNTIVLSDTISSPLGKRWGCAGANKCTWNALASHQLLLSIFA